MIFQRLKPLICRAKETILKKKNLYKTCTSVVYLVLCFMVIKGIFYAIAEKQKFITILAFTLYLTFLNSNKITFWLIVCPLLWIFCLYLPFAHTYGAPDYQALISFLGTNPNESLEFLGLIPTRYFISALAIPLLAVFTYSFSRKYNIKLYENKHFIILTIIVSILAIHPIQFFSRINRSIQDYREVSSIAIPSTVESSYTKESDKDFILLIGESARKDYFQLYGYPVKNNPFLEKANAIVVDGLTSGGTHTAESLSNMLTAGQDWKPRLDRTFIDFAKSAGIRTTWITNNQSGITGRFNTPLSALSIRADKAIRLPPSTNDLTLLTPFEREINKKAKSLRLFIIHSQGSHPNACKRVQGLEENYIVNDEKFAYIGCYVSSIKLTDNLIGKIYGILEEHKKITGREYSLIYFSDHGMMTDTREGKTLLVHSKDTISGYAVPLLKIDSDSNKKIIYKSRKSGLRFTEGLVKWMGIENHQISSYDLFDGKDDPNDYGLSEKIKTPSIQDSPIDISGMLIPANE